MTFEEAIAAYPGYIAGQFADFCERIAADAAYRAPIRTGALRESITARTSMVGDRLEGLITVSAPYAVYVHEGTGRYHPRGRKTRWVYPVRHAGGVRFYTTEGQPAVPFLRDAVESARRALWQEGG